jgi:hypothetical protein
MSGVWVVLDPVTLDIVYNYVSDSSQKTGYSGYFEMCWHLEVPEGLSWDVVKGVQDGDQVTLTEDPAKVAQKTADQWTSVRAQQRQKLYESDWTCSVTDYEVPNKADWVAYRQALRDVTTQADPFAIVWPPAPVA